MTTSDSEEEEKVIFQRPRATSYRESICFDVPTFENKILEVIGHFGPYQRWIFAILTLCDMPAGMCMLFFIFSNANPGTRCRLYENNVTSENNFTIGGDVACETNGSKCIEFEYNDEYTSIITEWDLICDHNFIPKLTISIQFIGLIIGAGAAAQIADLYGRKKVMLTVTTMMMVSQSLVGFSNSWEVYSVIRFFVGVFAGGSLSLSFVMPMEFVGPSWRAFCGLLSCYSMGHALMCLVGFLTRDWRNLGFITGSLFSPLLLAILFVVPESPRWLIQKGRFEEAEAIIRRMAKYNGTPQPDMNCLKDICVLEEGNREEASRLTYLDLFKTKELAIRSVVVLFITFACSEMYYGIIVAISSFTGSVYLNATISAMTVIPIKLLCIPIVGKLGRKKSFLMFVVISIVCMFLIIILNATGHVEKNPHIVTGLALFGKSTMTATWSLVGIFMIETYPTLMRTLITGASSVTGRVGGMIAPQFALLGVVAHWIIPYIVHACLALGCGVLEVIFMPETNNEPLPEYNPKGKKKRMMSLQEVDEDEEAEMTLMREKTEL